MELRAVNWKPTGNFLLDSFFKEADVALVFILPPPSPAALLSSTFTKIKVFSEERLLLYLVVLYVLFPQFFYDFFLGQPHVAIVL